MVWQIWRENQEFSVTSANFEIPLKHLNGEVERAVECMSLEVRGESWLVT